MNIANARDTLLRLLTRAEDRAGLASAAEREPALRTVDPEQLERTAKLLRRDVVRRRRRGAGSLLEQFAKTLEGSDEDHITASFVRSPHFQDYDELPHGTLGLCAEEAFFRFLEDEGIGNTTIRRTEYLRAAALVLTVHDHPAFSIPRPFVAVGGGYVAIAPGPHLFASVAGRFIRGPIPPVVARVLAARGHRPTGEDPALWNAATTRISQLGFVFEPDENGVSAHYS